MHEDPANHALTEGGSHFPASKHAAPKRLTMRVKVFSPTKTYFDEQAVSVSGENLTGPFDILPQHHNFITLLEPCELVMRRGSKQGSQRIKISGGLMHVKADKVVVFLDV